MSHHKGGNSGEKSVQLNLITQLRHNYDQSTIKDYNFYVQPVKKGNKYGGEESQRARSILFISLGLIVANSYGEQVSLVVPENGLISLNIPLTKTRYGSYSTRTTHPSFLHKVEKILSSIAIQNDIVNPYRFKTKGEMLAQSKNYELVAQLAHKTRSCAHPSNKRWVKRNEDHCGNCVPCIIRRASMYKSELDAYSDHYITDVISNPIGQDLRAFRIGLSRYSSFRGNRLFEILKSGPIPCSDDELREYIDVYERGMEEVENFLNQK